MYSMAVLGTHVKITPYLSCDVFLFFYKAVYSSISGWWKISSQSLLGKICHLLLPHLASSTSATLLDITLQVMKLALPLPEV